MRHRLHIDEFEDYLQQQANQHKMYPSDHVWRNIQKEVHGYKKWPGLSITAIVIISALVAFTIIKKPQPDVMLSEKYSFSLADNSIVKGNVQNEIKTSARISERILPEYVTRKTIAEAREKIKVQAAIDNYTHNYNNEILEVIQVSSEARQGILKADRKIITENKTLIAAPAAEEVAFNSSLSNSETLFNQFRSRLKNQIFYSSFLLNNEEKQFVFKNTSHDYARDIRQIAEEVKNPRQSSPLEKLRNTSSRFDFRFYITPSVSYRILRDKSGSIEQGLKEPVIPFKSNYVINPNEAIRHKPAIGYETGIALGYKLNNHFSLISGFQFNISQYKVDAFIHNSQTAGSGQNGETSLNTLSSLMSTNGGTPITLTNRYYELSIPVGIDWKAWTNGKFSWGVAAAMQPTYTFDKQPLIISAGFKNYTDGSPLIRNWNLNSNVETYVGYNTGDYKWHIGPQFRYQILSSLKNQYPIKENLLNYGIKVGVVKSLN